MEILYILLSVIVIVFFVKIFFTEKTDFNLGLREEIKYHEKEAERLEKVAMYHWSISKDPSPSAGNLCAHKAREHKNRAEYLKKKIK